MPAFSLKPIGPELWEIACDGKRVGELQCSWMHGYEARFGGEHDAKLATEFWQWLSANRSNPQRQPRFKWL